MPSDKILRMKQNLLFTASLLLSIGLTKAAKAQNDLFAFAITDLQGSGRGCNALRKLDIRSGEFSTVLFNGADPKLLAYDARTNREWKAIPDRALGNYMQAPFSTGVAALAYDIKNHRLYFTPMYIDQLRYVDCRTMKVYYVTDQSFTQAGNMQKDEGKIITRMTFDPDGNGYGISNDGNTFVRFNAGQELKITQLGPLTDDGSNSDVSIHDRCSCWGGDIISDDAGNLYLLTSRQSVYKINVKTRIAKLIGHINGLPKRFTVEGAVVTNDGKVLVSSALNGSAYFIVDPNDWSATIYQAKSGVFRSPDLANGNYLKTKPDKTPDNLVESNIRIFPNPVANNQFTLQFGKITSGTYDMELTKAMGQVVMQRAINVQSENQTEIIPIPSVIAKGLYLVKITGAGKNTVFSQKVIVQ